MTIIRRWTNEFSNRWKQWFFKGLTIENQKPNKNRTCESTSVGASIDFQPEFDGHGEIINSPVSQNQFSDDRTVGNVFWTSETKFTEKSTANMKATD